MFFPEVPALPLQVVLEVVAPPGVEVRLVELGHVLGGDGVPRGLVGVALLQDLGDEILLPLGKLLW